MDSDSGELSEGELFPGKRVFIMGKLMKPGPLPFCAFVADLIWVEGLISELWHVLMYVIFCP